MPGHPTKPRGGKLSRRRRAPKNTYNPGSTGHVSRPDWDVKPPGQRSARRKTPALFIPPPLGIAPTSVTAARKNATTTTPQRPKPATKGGSKPVVTQRPKPDPKPVKRTVTRMSR